MALAAVLELAYRADSNSAVREDLWVRVPPAVPSHSADQFPCRAVPPDATLCIDVLDLDDRYAFVLGLYLGDGMLSRGRRHVWRLRVSLDTKYPGILDEARTAIGVVAGRSVGSTSRPGCVEIRSDWKHWICLSRNMAPVRSTVDRSASNLGRSGSSRLTRRPSLPASSDPTDVAA